jgi:hypothetical protein
VAGEDDQDHAAHPAKVVDDPFRVFVVDLLGEDKRHPAWTVAEGSDNTEAFITATLGEWMTEVANVNHPGAKAKVVFTTSVPADVRKNELVVRLTSVPGSKFGPTAAKVALGSDKEDKDPPAQGLTGLIDERGKKGKRLLCEVWPGTIRGGADQSKFTTGGIPGLGKFNKLMCQLIFHELMHCKVDVDTEPTVHARKRTASLGGIPIGDDSPNRPTPIDVDDLGHDLAKEFTHFGAP